jgi:hypothetical protein
MNLVWNPNDIFNSYSFLDFDYEERPGMDGVSLIFYPSATSPVTAVYMAGDSAADMRGAALGRANLLGYDLQVLAGYVDNDVCAGAGWSGQIVRAAFRGECTYFHPARDHGLKTVVGSASADYTFPHDIYCQGSFIYNSAGIAGRHGDYAGLDIPGSTAKRLSPCRWTLFAELSAQVTPLFRIDCPGIINPGDGSGMVGPSCTMSLTEEIDVDFVGQVFFGGSRTVYGGMGKTVNGRLRWSF